MNIDLNAIEDFFSFSTYVTQKNEIEKAKEISRQLSDSVTWLEHEAKNYEDPHKKNSILMEAEAARQQLTMLNKAINKAENLNE